MTGLVLWLLAAPAACYLVQEEGYLNGAGQVLPRRPHSSKSSFHTALCTAGCLLILSSLEAETTLRCGCASSLQCSLLSAHS